MNKYFLIFIFCIISHKQIIAQNEVAIGISGVYNFPLKTTGIGARAVVPVFNKFSIVPQVKYLPNYNKIHELFTGVNLHYVLVDQVVAKNPKSKKDPFNLQLYLAAGVEYNRWINYTITLNDRAKVNNILPETGIGITYGTNNFKIFSELKYNIFWKESYAEIGLLIQPKSIKKMFSGGGGSSTNCPDLR